MNSIKIKTLMIFLGLALVLAVLDTARFLDGPKSVVSAATTPGQYLVYGVKTKVNDWFSFLTFWKSGEARIKNLEQRVLELTVAKNRVAVLEKENTELRKQLAASAKAPASQRELLPAVVLGLSRYLEIGAGSDQGVGLGQTVVYGDNLVGKIVKVSRKVAFVQMPRDPETKIAVRVGVARGLASGEFNFKIKISQVAQNEEIRADDLVVTSGEGDYLPELVVGKIGKTTVDRTGLFKEAEIVPFFDVNKLSIAFVVLN